MVGKGGSEREKEARPRLLLARLLRDLRVEEVPFCYLVGSLGLPGVPLGQAQSVWSRHQPKQETSCCANCLPRRRQPQGVTAFLPGDGRHGCFGVRGLRPSDLWGVCSLLVGGKAVLFLKKAGASLRCVGNSARDSDAGTETGQ